MRKWIVSLSVAAALMIVGTTLLLSGFGLQSSSDPQIEMVAFNHLTRAEQARIPISPKDSVISKLVVDPEIAAFVGNQYSGKEVYSVTFNRTETETSGNLTVYIDIDRKTIIGKGAAHTTRAAQ